MLVALAAVVKPEAKVQLRTVRVRVLRVKETAGVLRQ
tara:strand:- start:510 stop:620 length:111 start_codon:yes stop_codon:yes gene_type:complete